MDTQKMVLEFGADATVIYECMKAFELFTLGEDMVEVQPHLDAAMKLLDTYGGLRLARGSKAFIKVNEIITGVKIDE